MRIVFLIITVVALFSSSCKAAGVEESGPSNELVDIATVAPGISVDLRYATSGNFTGQAIYQCGRCFLRAKTAKKLARAQLKLQRIGLGLKVWDCYRPMAVQKLFWALVPDSRFVADPRKGSRHNRGASVDLTLVDASGKELPMPTPFDAFTPKAAHSCRELPDNVRGNRDKLARAMREAGFIPLASEWWHYDDSDWKKAPLLDVPFSTLCTAPASGRGS